MAGATGVILGDWTHRRGDAGGTRSVSADVARARPEVAWTWRPDHGGRVDQVRIAGECLFVATMMPRDDDAPGWEHAVVYALDAKTGSVIARRPLADPVPVAAMVVDGGIVHVVATRKAEPIYWYALEPSRLAPVHRKIIELVPRDARREDVLDAWAAGSDGDGGLWLEIESAFGATGARGYVFVSPGDAATTTGVARTYEADAGTPHDLAAPARDACCDGHALYAPLGGDTPALFKLEPVGSSGEASRAWARAEIGAARAQVHAVCAEGLVCAVVAAGDPEHADRAHVKALAIDRSTATVRYESPIARVALRGGPGDGARVARRSGGEIVFQRIAGDGGSGSDLVCIRPDGQLDSIPLGNGKNKSFVFDAALGDSILAHRESKGRVIVSGYEIDREGRLLGRRGVARWSVDTPDLGGSTTVYAGAGHIVVRGLNGIAAIRV